MTYQFEAMRTALSSGKDYELPVPYRRYLDESTSTSEVDYPYTPLPKPGIRKEGDWPVIKIFIPFALFCKMREEEASAIAEVHAEECSLAAQKKLNASAKLRTHDIPLKIIAEYIDDSDTYLRYINCINTIYQKEVIPSKELAKYNQAFRSALASSFVRQCSSEPFYWSDREMLQEASTLPVFLNLYNSKGTSKQIINQLIELSKLSTKIQAVSFSLNEDYEEARELYAVIDFLVYQSQIKYICIGCTRKNAKLRKLSDALLYRRPQQAVPLTVNLYNFPLRESKRAQLVQDLSQANANVCILQEPLSPHRS